MTTKRLIAISFISGGLCFVAGLALAKFSAGAVDAERGGDETRESSQAARPISRLTALPAGSPHGKRTASQFMALAQSKEFGMYEKMCGYIRLISEAEPSEMPSCWRRCSARCQTTWEGIS